MPPAEAASVPTSSLWVSLPVFELHKNGNTKHVLLHLALAPHYACEILP